jgi:3-phytase
MRLQDLRHLHLIQAPLLLIRGNAMDLRKLRVPLIAALIGAVLTACSVAPATVAKEPDERTAADPLLAASGVAHVTVRERFVTPLTPQDNVDSPALWLGPDGKAVLLATAKKTGRLMRYDGDSGAAAGAVGKPGTAAGQFDRPNGIFVHDDLLFVVERDNHRVQVLRLPGFESLGSFGETELQQPYGIWLRAADGGGYDVLVSDAYMAGKDANGDDIVPPLAELDRRVRRYAVTVSGGTVRATLRGSVGDTSDAGAIRIPESLWGDTVHDRLLIAEEDTITGTAVREYDLAGRYKGRTLGLGLFKAQAEGIALWQCADGSGYWIATDQFKDRSLFHIFDRVTLEHLGAFAGETVANTDGIWLHQAGTKRFPQGVFYAVHDDQGVGAFDWADIARTLGLRARCG